MENRTNWVKNTLSFNTMLKNTLLALCWVYARVRGEKQRPAILMYHSFDSSGWKFGVHPKDLQRQLEYLKRQYTLVPLADMVQFAWSKKELPENAVAITIDDGYEDTYSVFFPLAKEHKIPFTLFLTTDLTRKKTFGDLPRPTIDQLREMQDSGLVTFGLHGHTHMHFPKVLEQDRVVAEFGKSETFFQKELGLLPSLVAYPSGRKNEAVLDYFRARSRYIAGMTIQSGFVRPGDDLFTLPRIEVSRNTPTLTMFKLRLTPALDVYNKLVTKLK